MIIEVISGITTIRHEDGYKYVSNGEIWSEGTVWLGKFDSVDNWHDTNDEPPEPPEPEDNEINNTEVTT